MGLVDSDGYPVEQRQVNPEELERTLSPLSDELLERGLVLNNPQERTKQNLLLTIGRGSGGTSTIYVVPSLRKFYLSGIIMYTADGCENEFKIDGIAFVKQYEPTSSESRNLTYAFAAPVEFPAGTTFSLTQGGSGQSKITINGWLEVA